MDDCSLQMWDVLLQASSQKKDQSFKPGKPAADPSLESPSWLKSFIEDNQKKVTFFLCMFMHRRR